MRLSRVGDQDEVDDIEIGSNRAGVLCASEHLADRGFHTVAELMQMLLAEAYLSEHLGQTAILLPLDDGLFAQRHQGFPGVWDLLGVGGRVDDLLHPLDEQRLHERVSIGESAVDRAHADAGGAGDLVEADLDPLLGE